jgi:hypothetical protein
MIKEAEMKKSVGVMRMHISGTRTRRRGWESDPSLPWISLIGEPRHHIMVGDPEKVL